MIRVGLRAIVRKHGILVAALVLLTASGVRADGLSFTYDGDSIPGEPASGLQIDDPCEPPNCSLHLDNGRLVLEWGVMGDEAFFSDAIASQTQPPPTLWLEWRFRSNQPRPPTSISCDAKVNIVYDTISERVYMFQDIAFSGTSGFPVALSPEFHTFRFEGFDGINYTVAVDGVVFKEWMDGGPHFSSVFSFGGDGGCGDFRPDPVRNEWDFVRWGAIGTGEQLVSADPPAGNLTPAQANQLSSIILTFDQPAYLYIDDITVTTTGGTPPTVMGTRRLDNGAPEVLEVVINGQLPPGETTTFSFDTGSGTQSVSYYRFQADVPASSTWGLVVMGLTSCILGMSVLRRDAV